MLRSGLLPTLAAAALAAGLGGCGKDDPTLGTNAPDATSPGQLAPGWVLSDDGPQPTTANAARGPALAGAAKPVGSTPPVTLAFGRWATVAHDEYLGDDFVPVPLRVTITRVDVGTPADLKSFPLQGSSRTATPLYVHARFQNLGRRTFNATGIAGGLLVADDRRRPLRRLDLIGSFPRCQVAGAKAFTPGDTTATCDVFLLPAGRTLETVRYSDRYGAQYRWRPAAS